MVDIVIRRNPARARAHARRAGGPLTLVAYFVLTGWAVLALFPIYWMFKNSFEPAMAMGVFPPAPASGVAHAR